MEVLLVHRLADAGDYPYRCRCDSCGEYCGLTSNGRARSQRGTPVVCVRCWVSELCNANCGALLFPPALEDIREMAQFRAGRN